MFESLKKWLGFEVAAPLVAAPATAAPAAPPVVGICGGNADSASVRAMMTQIQSAGAIAVFLGNHANRDASADIEKIDALV